MRSVPIVSVVCSITLLAGCSLWQKPVITPEMRAEKDDAGLAYIKCLRIQARQLDDHTSAPATIAPNITKACQQEFHNFIMVSEKGLSSGDTEEFEMMVNNPNQQQSVAIDVVQYQRQEQ